MVSAVFHGPLEAASLAPKVQYRRRLHNVK
jgi:hypothetical protein